MRNGRSSASLALRANDGNWPCRFTRQYREETIAGTGLRMSVKRTSAAAQPLIGGRRLWPMAGVSHPFRFRLSIAAIQTAGCPACGTAGHGPVRDLADVRDARSPIRVCSRDPVLKMLPGVALPDRQSAACRVCEVCAGFRSSSVSRACRSDERRASVPSPGPV